MGPSNGWQSVVPCHRKGRIDKGDVSSFKEGQRVISTGIRFWL